MSERQDYGGFLLSLEQESLADEAYLRIYRETGRTTDLIDRLLALGRIDEAAQETRRVEDYALLGLADLFIIALRERKNYQAACIYLVKMRTLYEKLCEREEWASYITALREQNRNLRALKEELADAGL